MFIHHLDRGAQPNPGGREKGGKRQRNRVQLTALLGLTVILRLTLSSSFIQMAKRKRTVIHSFLLLGTGAANESNSSKLF